MPESASRMPNARPTVVSTGGQPRLTPDTRPAEDSTEGAIRGSTAANAPDSPGTPCCTITGLDAGSATASARVTTTGEVFAFVVSDRRLFGSLNVGQAVSANFKTGQASLDGRSSCCAIVRGSPGSAQTRSQSTSQSSVPGGVVVPGNINRPALSNPDIAGEQEPLQYVIHDRSSEVTARFQNVGTEIPADSSAMSPRPSWYVDGQVRQPDDAGNFGVHLGRPAWPTLAERSYTAKFTLPRGSHQIRAVMQVMPGEQNPANNAATIPVTSGEAELSAQYDEEFINNGDAGSYWRFRFWAQNSGDIPATCGLRLDFYDRSGFQDPNAEEPWHLRATVTDDVTVASGAKSEYFFVQLRYNGTFSDPTHLPQPPHQYRFVLSVDQANVVVEANKANNTLEDKTLRAGADTLKWGKNPW